MRSREQTSRADGGGEPHPSTHALAEQGAATDRPRTYIEDSRPGGDDVSHYVMLDRDRTFDPEDVRPRIWSTNDGSSCQRPLPHLGRGTALDDLGNLIHGGSFEQCLMLGVYVHDGELRGVHAPVAVVVLALPRSRDQ